MSKLKAFSIRDIKGAVYTPPFYKSTHGEAERDFRSLVNDDKTTINKYAEDFQLYYVGEYDQTSGSLIPAELTHIADAISLKN